MKTTKIYASNVEIQQSIKKSTYISPSITIISMDNEISLSLQSAPPTGPNELIGKAPEYFIYNPFIGNRA
jgi:hypothetical protein